MTGSERENAFKRWLDRNGFRQSTTLAYCHKLQDTSKSFSAHDMRQVKMPRNLFNVSGIRRLDSLKERIHALPCYADLCRKDRRTFHSALNRYIEFFEDFAPERISDLVKRTVVPLLERMPGNADEISRIQDFDYCKNILDLNFPMLVSETKRFNRSRYYVMPIVIANNRYYITNDWYERQRGSLNQWIARCESIIAGSDTTKGK